MYRIALNNAITRVRKKTNAFAELKDEALQIAITDNHPDERMLEMYDAIKKLSEVERAITMLYLEDCSYKEMSEILGITESNVGFKLNKIKAKLRTLIKVA